MKKSVCILYIEFFKEQDIKELEDMIRSLSKRKKFPAFRTLIPMVHYRNLSSIKDVKLKVNPPYVFGDVNDEVEP